MHKVGQTGPKMEYLCQVLATKPSGLLTKLNSTMLVIDCGASSTMTSDKITFKQGTLQIFAGGEQSPIQDIARILPIKGQGIISLQVTDNEGEVIDIETQAYYILELQTKLFSPQVYFSKQNDNSEFIIMHDGTRMHFVSCTEGEKTHEIMFAYNQQTCLPLMCTY